MMFSDSTRIVIFAVMVVLGVSSLAAFLLAQYHVKLNAPDLWDRFFPGRSVGFARDLKFHRFSDWFSKNDSPNIRAQLPYFQFLWTYYFYVNRLAFIPFSLFIADFGFVVYQTGMIGGWRFR